MPQVGTLLFVYKKPDFQKKTKTVLCCILVWLALSLVELVEMSFVVSVLPLPCLSVCFCLYSVVHEANTMNCSHSNMTKLPAKVLPRTELLIMTGNNLQESTDVKLDLIGVNHIDLRGNHIQKISDNLFKEVFLIADTVKLSDNYLRQLPSFLQQTKIAATLWLGNNPFDCNCNMMWMKDWLQSTTNVMDKENITCGYGSLKGLSVSHFIVVVVLLV